MGPSSEGETVGHDRDLCCSYPTKQELLQETKIRNLLKYLRFVGLHVTKVLISTSEIITKPCFKEMVLRKNNAVIKTISLLQSNTLQCD